MKARIGNTSWSIIDLYDTSSYSYFLFTSQEPSKGIQNGIIIFSKLVSLFVFVLRMHSNLLDFLGSVRAMCVVVPIPFHGTKGNFRKPELDKIVEARRLCFLSCKCHAGIQRASMVWLQWANNGKKSNNGMWSSGVSTKNNNNAQISLCACVLFFDRHKAKPQTRHVVRLIFLTVILIGGRLPSFHTNFTPAW